ncbi:MAG: hypothetical protein H0U67_10695 [Gemmatimonadetes bacterium]|nr:hypothetical protein [Gemmatimonadota bacterium]
MAYSPGYATGHQWFSYYLSIQNRTDDALREMEIAYRLDPLSHVIVLSLAAGYDAVGRYPEAAPLYAQGFDLAPDAWWSVILFCNHVLVTNGLDAATPCYRRSALATGSDTARANDLERALRDPARRDSAIDAMARHGNPLDAVPLLKVLRGDDAVIAHLRAMAARPERVDFHRCILAVMLGVRLRSDSRVRGLLVQLGYPGW